MSTIKVADLLCSELGITTINISEWNQQCTLCGEWALLRWCVPFYEEPVHAEIGATLFINADGHPAIVGGMTCCKVCHDEHEARAAAKGDSKCLMMPAPPK
jgi:hypothetical protein